MDVFEKAQHTRPHIEGADENLAAARARLMAEIQTTRAPAHASAARRPWLIAGGLIGAAAAVTAGVLVANALSMPTSNVEAIPTKAPIPSHEPVPSQEPVPTPTVEPPTEPLTPATVFRSAANTAGTVSGPVAGEGQYLRVEHSTEQLVKYDPAGEHTKFDGSRANATAAWTVRGRYVTYIPADRAGEWVQAFEPGDEVLQYFGTDAPAHAEEWMRDVPDEAFVVRTVGGIREAYPGSTDPIEGSDAYYAKMPRDPVALIEWFRSQSNGVEPGHEDSAVIWGIVDTLSLNAAPADLRSALYLALALVPGADILATSGNVVTIGFRPNHPIVEEWSETVSIDTATGMVVSSTQTVGSGSSIIPDEVPDHRLTNSISVVDEAP